MQLDSLSDFAPLALAGSLAMERLVVIAKTMFPWLAKPVAAEPGESEYDVDQRRRLAVLAITMTASLTTAWLIGQGNVWYMRTIAVSPDRSINWLLFGLMISGGSAFWTSIVSFASAAKDVRKLEKASLAVQVTQAAAAAPALTAAPPSARVVPTI
ncbi:hypothetical protein [Gemmatimonas sp.]|jgi:hypothetical protein|uniref:hypothetical protein n=1 Tax=Gemmatimonas sp. TaxID=1962908 RepID=UPI0037C090AB